jgi:hypothetical protein
VATGSTSRHREFDEPIALPDERKLVVLRHAASYITTLPSKEAAAPQWQASIEAADAGGRARRHAGIEPRPSSGIHIPKQRASLEQPQAEE